MRIPSSFPLRTREQLVSLYPPLLKRIESQARKMDKTLRCFERTGGVYFEAIPALISSRFDTRIYRGARAQAERKRFPLFPAALLFIAGRCSSNGTRIMAAKETRCPARIYFTKPLAPIYIRSGWSVRNDWANIFLVRRGKRWCYCDEARGSHCAGNELVGRVRRFESSKEMLEMELAARCKAVIRSVVIIEEKKDWIWTSFGGFYTIGYDW